MELTDNGTRQLVKGFVALVDILGAKGRPPKELWGKLKKSHASAIERAQRELTKLDPTLLERFDMSIFGDMMLFTFEDFGDKQAQLMWLLGYLGFRLREDLHSDLPLRGALAYGEYYHPEKNIVLGPAADDAATCYEQSDWIGVHITEKTLQELKSCWEKPTFPSVDNPDDNEDYERVRVMAPIYDLPIKKKTVIGAGTKKKTFCESATMKSRAISWMQWRLSNEEDDVDIFKTLGNSAMKDITKLKELVGLAPLEAKEKYENTIRFIEWFQVMERIVLERRDSIDQL
jgi:hypothetical protein